jgi:cadmium resistance protein CadD (predicted permease)
MIGLIGIGVVLFASTNIDDIFVLVAFFADARFRAAEIVAGQYAGIALLVTISIAASLSAAVLPLHYLGLVAIVPIVLGARRLLELFNGRNNAQEGEIVPPTGRGHGRIATVALVTIMNGGDNVGIYMPAFAVHSRMEIALIVFVFFVMTVVWCLLAHRIVNHPRLGAPIRRYGRVVAPVVLIALGLVVMFQAGTLGVLYKLL